MKLLKTLALSGALCGLLTASTLGATVRWLGAASARRHVVTITVANVWAAADTGTLTSGQGDLILTAGAAVATSDIAQAITAAVNGTDASPGLIGTETRNANGRSINTFKEFTAETDGATVVLTGTVPGIPFTVTVSESTAGTGTLAVATTTEATGPWHADDPNNWVGGSLPSAGDILQWDSGSVPCLYGLEYFVTNTIEISLNVTTDYEGTIGLPAINVLGNYPEYRQRGFKPYDVTPDENITFERGLSGSGAIVYLDLENWDGVNIYLYDTGGIKQTPSVTIVDGACDAFRVGSGWVAIDPVDFPSAGGHDINDILVGNPGGGSDVKLTIGSATTWDGSQTMTVHTGSVICSAKLQQGTGDEMALVQYDGQTELRGAQATYDITIRGGTLWWNATGATTEIIFAWTGAVLDFRNGGSAVTFTNQPTLYGASTIHKGGLTISPTFVGCIEDDCTVNP